MTVMSAKLRRECTDVIAHYGGVRLTTSQFEDLLIANPKLEKQLIKFNAPSDTMDRECLLSALAVQVVGRDWPCNMDGRETADKFFVDYRDALIVKGYTLVK